MSDPRDGELWDRLEAALRLSAELMAESARILAIAKGKVHNGSVTPAPGSPPTPPLAEPAARPLPDAIEEWKGSMRRRGKRAASIKRFGWIVEMCAGWNEWRTVADLAWAGASRWLGHKRDTGWGGATHDQGASALRSFGQFCYKAGYLDKNPLALLESSGEKGDQGSRALTTEEVRRLVYEAWNRARYDARAKRSNRALFYTFLALTGLRHNEAVHICWKDVDLDSKGGPHLLTDPAWSKNKPEIYP